MLSIDYNRKSHIFGDVNVCAQNQNFNIPLILDKYTIMIVMQELKCMQEYTFALNVEFDMAICKQNC